MTISIAEINRITLRQFQRYFERELRALGVPLQTPWNPSDAELERIAQAFGEAGRDYDGLDVETSA